MARSPRLTKDELVLLLDTYRAIGADDISANHPRVRWLSDVLKRLPIYPPEKRPEEQAFRPPEGLRSRLNEFRRIDEGANDRSLHAYRALWDRYKEGEKALRHAAEDILRRHGLAVDQWEPYQMAIPYNQQMSRFYAPCREAIEGCIRTGRLGEPATVRLASRGGYGGDVHIHVDPGQAEQFWTDWASSDPTRFPARIRAAATALRDTTRGGRFRVAHDDGTLTIEQVRTPQSPKWGGADSASPSPDESVDPLRNPQPTKESVRAERALRKRLWDRLKREGGPQDVSPDVVRELGLYKGQAGIWADKSRTKALTADGHGVTVSVLHTGSEYADDLDAEGLLYHYPDTRRPGRHDANEIESTKNAARFDLPIFVVTYPHPDASTRNVYLGRVADWDDEAHQFWIRFDVDAAGSDRLGRQLEMNWGQRTEEPGHAAFDDEEPFQLTESSELETTQVPSRPGQSRFKFKVVKRYGLRCAVCELDVDAMLDACHIRGKAHQGSDHSGNGLVLCANHHRAFDNGLFAIEPDTLCIKMEENYSAEEIEVTRSSISTAGAIEMS